MNKDELISQYLQVKDTVPTDVQLVAVSKNHSSEAINYLYEAGQKVFGENKVQELIEKYEVLPKDIEWHLIGHLQTNKVKYIAPFVHTIQSVDSEKVLKEINKDAAKNDRTIEILLQVKIAAEDSKFGFTVADAQAVFQKYLANDFPHVKINGLMGMATFTEDEDQIKNEFSILKNLFDEFKAESKIEILSMGMSGDYKTAISSGANSVRIGSSIFGERK